MSISNEPVEIHEFLDKSIPSLGRLTVLLGPDRKRTTRVIDMIKKKLSNTNVSFYSYSKDKKYVGSSFDDNFRPTLKEIYDYIFAHAGNDKLYFFFDNIDGNFDVWSILFLKEVVFNRIDIQCREMGITAYIICASNSFELSYRENAYDIENKKPIFFNDYDDYDNYISEIFFEYVKKTGYWS